MGDRECYRWMDIINSIFNIDHNSNNGYTRWSTYQLENFVRSPISVRCFVCCNSRRKFTLTIPRCIQKSVTTLLT